jgi:class 3 adenylate cyclase/tetratricopeptide (TPR) repeat protein
MECPACDQPNREDARFCLKCGALLSNACPGCGCESGSAGSFCDNCGQELDAGRADRADPRAYTPAHLAKKVLQDRSKLQGERRTVTVLFADAVGSTAMEEKLDPEQTFRLMQGAVACMADAVHHCEGIITQFRGDGIMALFGAPIAHENAAHRAVAAALAMQQRLDEYAGDVEREHGVVLRFRVGLNTGLVVVGAISDNLSMDYTAMGDTVNLASRMEQLADPGAVFLSDSTYQAVRDYVECEPMGALEVKGKSEPVVAYRAVREMATRSRLEVAASRGLTPFVGRHEELAQLRHSIEHVKQGAGQVVFLSGEAGIGKSRLLLELRRSLGDDVAWLEGRCLPHGAGSSHPIVDVAKGAFGIGDCDDEASIVARLDGATSGWSEESRATVPYLKYALGVPPGDQRVGTVMPQERRNRIEEAVRALLIEESARRPLVVVIEDLHWVDEGTNSTLFGLLSAVASAPVLMILTHRPHTPPAAGMRINVLEAESVLPAHDLGNLSFYQRLVLDQLSTDECASLAASALGAALPQDLRQLIIGKAEGNPFFVEEVTRSLLESGVLQRTNGSYALREGREVSIPDTIQEVLLARIDRLEQQPRETVQLASVIGREFSRPLLARISDPQTRLDAALAELQELEFIYEAAYVPEFSYAFKHALSGEVAYSTLLRERRRNLHRTVATSMEELYADRLPEHYEMLAHHYLEGEVWEKALDYLEKAGDRAFALYANEPAIDFYTKALAVCERFGDAELRHIAILLQKRGTAHFNLRHYVECLEGNARLHATSARLGDVLMEGTTLVTRGIMELWHETYEGGLAILENALALANEKDLDPVRLLAFTNLTMAYYDCYRMDDARRALESAMELAERVQPASPAVSSQSILGVKLDPGQKTTILPLGNVLLLRNGLAVNGGHFLVLGGRFDDALALLDRHGDANAALPNIFFQLHFHFLQALALGGKGQYERALALLNEVIATCERLGEHFFQGRMMNTLGWIYGDLQDFDRAIEWNERSLQAARGWSPRQPDVEANALANLADNFIALGRLDEAEERLREIAKMVEEKVPKDCMISWRHTLRDYATFADLWLARGDSERALSAAEQCLALAEKTESRKYIIRAHRVRGQALMAQGKLAEADEDISSALPLAVEVGNPPQLWRTHVALGELRRAQGRPGDARHAYENALSVIESVAAGLTGTHLRDTFLRSEHVRGIKAAAEVAPAHP